MSSGDMKEKLRIAIVGGGLGGLTAAIQLEQKGYNYTVYEQAPQLARIGAGINLYQNTTRLFKHMGLLDKMLETGISIRTWLNREWDTGRIYFSQLEDEWTEKYGAPHICLHRGDLQQIMTDAVRPDRLKFGKQLVGLDERGGVIRMTFKDGTTEEADIVIGADGVNSVVREILLGPEEPTYTGFVAYRAIFPTKLLGNFKLSADGSKYWSDERQIGEEDRHWIYYYLTKSRDEVYFVTGSPDPNFEGFLPVEVDMAEVKKCYEGFHEDVQQMIDACPRTAKWPLLTRKPLPLWNRGRIVLLGDACHPMKPHMGQGAGMAIEDAVLLVRCIDAAEGDYAGAFEFYKANRIGRASRVQSISNANIWMRYPTDPTWCYGYDALTVPLVPIPSGEKTAA